MAIENTTKSITHLVDIEEMPKSPGNRIQLARNPTMHPMQIARRREFRGLHILNRIIKPTIAKSIVAAVDRSSPPTPNVRLKIASAATTNTSVSHAGRDFSSTFCKNRPLITFLCGWRDRKNPGMPIVNMLIREIWEGPRG